MMKYDIIMPFFWAVYFTEESVAMCVLENGLWSLEFVMHPQSMQEFCG